MHQSLTIDEQSSGQRIDKFLAGKLPLHTRGDVARAIKSGQILANDKEIKPSYHLKSGDAIAVLSLPEKKLEPNPSIDFDILYSEDDFLVINKPAGLQVHPSSTEQKNTLANGLVSRFPEIAAVHDGSVGADSRPGIVHRLDKDTSGVMVIARNGETLVGLKELFQNRKVEKHYIALAYGVPAEKKGSIEKSVARSTDYRKQVIAHKKTATKTREARTDYNVLEEFSGKYSLLELTPHTGRTHQIRLHLHSIGHPIVGDRLYTLRKYSQDPLQKTSRQLLHAHQLTFAFKSRKHSFSAPLPSDFSETIAILDEKA